MRHRRIVSMMMVFLFIYAGLLINIFYLQIIKGSTIAGKAVAMRDRRIELNEYTRGEIRDRNLMPLTGAVTYNTIYCLPGVITREYREKYSASNPKPASVLKKQAFKEFAEKLAPILTNVSPVNLINILNEGSRKGSSLIRIPFNLSNEQIEKINSSNISGLVVAPTINRYRTDGFAAHIIGYLGGNGSGDGKAGLESRYNDLLKQNPSSNELVSVLDARGIAIQGLMFKIRKEQDQNKSTVVLTIDKRIQQVVEDAMNRRMSRGAVVVMDIASKEVLAIASRPTFNPYKVEQIIKDNHDSTLMNRALTCYYPGSLFKILLASAALEEKVVKISDQFNCTGEYVFSSGVTISCWKEEGHGKLNFEQAFANSCNPSLIETGLRLGRSRLLKYVDAFHFTDGTLVGYHTDNNSYVKIDPGEPALGNACLGQRGVMVTPLQVASLISTIADNGRWAPPILVRYTVGGQGRKTVSPKQKPEQVISFQTARQVQQLMEKVVNEGTGKTARLPEVMVAGKTATSQTGQIKDNDGKSEEILNTWFAGYFPADNPRWAVVVMVEEGTSGAESAAPVFKDIAQGILSSVSDR